MNLYRVTRSDVGGGHPHSTVYRDRAVAVEEFEYLRNHTYFVSTLVGFHVEAQSSALVAELWGR